MYRAGIKQILLCIIHQYPFGTVGQKHTLLHKHKHNTFNLKHMKKY